MTIGFAAPLVRRSCKASLRNIRHTGRLVGLGNLSMALYRYGTFEPPRMPPHFSPGPVALVSCIVTLADCETSGV